MNNKSKTLTSCCSFFSATIIDIFSVVSDLYVWIIVAVLNVCKGDPSFQMQLEGIFAFSGLNAALGLQNCAPRISRKNPFPAAMEPELPLLWELYLLCHEFRS